MNKLMYQYTKSVSRFSLIVLIAAAIGYTLITRWLLIRQLDMDLKQEEQEIEEFAHLHDSLPSAMSFKGQIVSYEKISTNFKKRISNAYLFVQETSKERKHFRIYRKSEFPIQIENTLYRCTILRSQAETEGMVKLLVGITCGIGLLLFAGFAIYNRYILRDLWSPFNQILWKLSTFKLGRLEKWESPKTDILEFYELNSSIDSMIGQAIKDYNAQKNFTENASHEIQTPLAIVKSQLEILLQSISLRKDDSEKIVQALDATERLSRLTEALLLLTKIENRQFLETKELNLSIILQRLLKQYQELLENKNIHLSVLQKQLSITNMNEALAELLIGNLVRNAIVHNIRNGYIAIEMTDHYIQIANSGLEMTSKPTFLFQRFNKNSLSPNSLGLGLSIAKEIAVQYNMELSYSFENQKHILKLSW